MIDGIIISYGRVPPELFSSISLAAAEELI